MPIAMLVLGALVAPAPGQDAATDLQNRGPWFQPADGVLQFVYHSGHGDRFLFPEIMGGGAALFDMDQDGYLDAYLVQGGSLADRSEEPLGNQLFRNLGDGTFTDVTAGSGASDRGYGQGVSAGDYDNDGDVDLYVTNVGENVLLRNDAPGRFTDATREAGVGDAGWGAGAVFCDYDRDGDLDLFVANYMNWSPAAEMHCYNVPGSRDYCPPANYNAPARDVLYRNEGDGTFADVSEAAGLGTRFGTGLGVVCADFDADGWVDLFVANDGMRNQLWINQGDGTFRDDALLRGCAVDEDGKAKAGMGVAAADVNEDGSLDLLVGNIRTETDSFYLNRGTYFQDNTRAAGLGVASRHFTRFGLGLVDFDNDGLLDLYQANGRVMQQGDSFGSGPYAEPNLLLRGVGKARFEEVEPGGGTAEPLVAASRAASFGDIDNDGGVDILVVNRDGPAHLLRNVVPDRGHWILFRILDGHGRDAHNAKLSLRAGARSIVREVLPGSSYLSSNDPRVHIGLGEADSVTGVTVRWMDGNVESFGSFSADQIVEIRRGKGQPLK